MSYIENGGFLLVVLPSSSEMVKTLKSILNFMKDNRTIQTLATIELTQPFGSSTVSQTSSLHLVDLMCIEVYNSIEV